MIEPAPLADADVTQLEKLLADPALERAMRLDEVQAYLCAALSGPQAMPEKQWLSAVLGDADTTRSAVARQTATLLRRLARKLETDLAAGVPPVLLIYAAEGQECRNSDYLPWCQAYLHGVDAAAVDWFDALGAEDDKEDSEEICFLDEQLFPLFMLTGDAEAAAAEAGEEWPRGPELDRLRQECEDCLPQVITNIYRFWLAQRSMRTVRHEEARIGRNDPCSCGSGRKYKKCCGAA